MGKITDKFREEINRKPRKIYKNTTYGISLSEDDECFNYKLFNRLSESLSAITSIEGMKYVMEGKISREKLELIIHELKKCIECHEKLVK